LNRSHLILLSLLFFISCSGNPSGMIMIPEGVFTLGVNPNNKIIHFMSDTTLSLNAQPAQKIHLKSFFIDKFEVTYEAFHGFKPKFRYETVNPNEPIRGVSWYEADAYCLSQGKRLPWLPPLFSECSQPPPPSEAGALRDRRLSRSHREET